MPANAIDAKNLHKQFRIVRHGYAGIKGRIGAMVRGSSRRKTL
jgi:hypothetical protein